MVKNGWFKCEVCRRNIQKIEPGSILHGVPIYCRSCKINHYPSIWMGVELDRDEPFPVGTEDNEA